MMSNLPTIKFLASLAYEMGRRILPLFGKISADIPGLDLHTKADVLSEEIAIRKIKQKFPGHYIFSEETAREFPEEEFVWVIDPLDGTINFVQGIPLWSISIGFFRKREIVMGVIFDPVKKELFTTEKDKGAYLNGKKIFVGSKKALSRVVIGTDININLLKGAKENVQRISRLLEKVRNVRILGSTALGLAYVSCGRLDAFFHHGVTPFDVAAGELLIEEAGGIVTKLNGEKKSIFDKEVLVGGPAIHRQLVSIIR